MWGTCRILFGWRIGGGTGPDHHGRGAGRVVSRRHQDTRRPTHWPPQHPDTRAGRRLHRQARTHARRLGSDVRLAHTRAGQAVTSGSHTRAQVRKWRIARLAYTRACQEVTSGSHTRAQVRRWRIAKQRPKTERVILNVHSTYFWLRSCWHRLFIFH